MAKKRKNGNHEDENEQAGKEAYSGHELVEPLAGITASGVGTSTGTTALALASVTGTVIIGSTITGSGVPANTTIVSQQSGTAGKNGNYTTSAATTLAGITLTFTPGPTIGFFPDFTPIYPPPPVGIPPPPTFPPTGGNTTPVAVPAGPQVGPAIAPASAPPSVAGIVQPQFKTGSGTTPASQFPSFSVVLLNPPLLPSPLSGAIFNKSQVPPFIGAGAIYPYNPTPPPHTTNPANPLVGGVPLVMEAEDAGPVHRGNPGPAQRRGRSVLSDNNDHAQH